MYNERLMSAVKMMMGLSYESLQSTSLKLAIENSRWATVWDAGNMGSTVLITGFLWCYQIKVYYFLTLRTLNMVAEETQMPKDTCFTENYLLAKRNIFCFPYREPNHSTNPGVNGQAGEERPQSLYEDRGYWVLWWHPEHDSRQGKLVWAAAHWVSQLCVWPSPTCGCALCPTVKARWTTLTTTTYSFGLQRKQEQK